MLNVSDLSDPRARIRPILLAWALRYVDRSEVRNVCQRLDVLEADAAMVAYLMACAVAVRDRLDDEGPIRPYRTLGIPAPAFTRWEQHWPAIGEHVWEALLWDGPNPYDPQSESAPQGGVACSL